MTKTAILHFQQENEQYSEVGEVIDCGQIGFFSGKSVFAKSKPRPSKLEKKDASLNIGAIALIVRTKNRQYWVDEFSKFRKDRMKFRAVYFDGEMHTLEGFAFVQPDKPIDIHLHLHLFAPPIIENRKIETEQKFQKMLSDLNYSP